MDTNELVRQLVPAIRADRSITEEQRQDLLSVFSNPAEVNRLLAGTGTASYAVLIARYLNMGKTAQILMGLAGFGIGRVLADWMQKPNDQSRVLRYNEKLKAYNVNT